MKAGGIVLRTSPAEVQIKGYAEGRVVVRSVQPSEITLYAVGRRGPPGQDAPPGSGGSIEDPGDLRLLYENGLI
jgi:hypothetical protein